MLRTVVLTQYRRVTDGQTDGQTDGIVVASTALAKRRAVISDMAAEQSNLNSIDYGVWRILQKCVYNHHRITDVEELRQRVDEEWDRLDQEVIDNAISEWCKRLTACVAAGGGHFEHSL